MFSQPQGWFGLREPSRAFSAIVRKDGSTVWAEDASGKTIASGESGVDDASVIQSALDYVPDNSHLILKGEFSITKGIVITNRKNIMISGGVINVTQTLPTYTLYGTRRHVFGFGDCENIELRDMTFNCNGNGGAVCFEPLDCYAYGEEPAAKNIILRNLTIRGGGKTDEYTSAIYIRNVKGIKIFNCDISSPYSGEGIYIGAHPNYDIEIQGCIIRETWNNGIYLGEGINDAIVCGNIFFRCGQRSETDEHAGWGTDRHAIESTSSDSQGGCNRVVIANNIMRRCAAGGVEVKGNDIIICGNIIKECGFGIFTDVKGVVIASNRVEYCNGDGITFQGTDITVIGNIIKNNYTYGLGPRFCQRAYMIGNILYENNRKGDNYYGESRIESSDTYPAQHIYYINNYIKARSGIRGIILDKPAMDYIVIKGNTILSDVPIYKTADIPNYYVKGNIGYVTENSGTATFSGDGTTTQFSIAHGLVSTPTKVQVTPMTADAASDFYVTADDTNIYINYKSAPPSGTDNLKFSWYAEV